MNLSTIQTSSQIRIHIVRNNNGVAIVRHRATFVYSARRRRSSWRRRRPFFRSQGRFPLPALLDHHGSLLLVGVGVLDHPVLADEPLAAGLARERLLAGVEAHVSPEVRLVVELLRADVALVGLVPAVLGHVLLQSESERGLGVELSKTGSLMSVSWFWGLEFRHESFI